MKQTVVRTLSRTACLLGASLLAVSANVSLAEEVELDRIVAIVGEDVVMKTELDQRLASIYMRAQAANQPMPPRDELAKQVLDRLIDERLQLGLAERNNMQVSDAQINAALQDIAARQGLTFEKFVEQAHANGENLADLRRQISSEIKINYVQDGAVRQNIPVSLQEITNFLESDEGKFWQSPQLQLGHIQLNLSAGAPKDEVARVMARANAMRTELMEGGDFKQMALTQSAGQTALQGGDLGWRSTVELPQDMANAAKGLQPGEISEPIRNDAGVHLLKVYDRKGGQQQLILKEYDVRHILVKTNEIRDDEAAYNQLMKVREDLISEESEKDFAAYAKELSEDPGSKLSGGELGWNIPDRFVPEFGQMMQSVEVGEISFPFHTEHGWHILQVTEVRDQDFSGNVLNNRAREILVDRKFEEELSIWLQEQRDNTFIEIKL